MKHLGLMCPEISGHLNPMTTLGRELQRRGYRVSLIGCLDGERKAKAAGLELVPIAIETRPLGQTAKEVARLGELSGQKALAYTIALFYETNETILREAPQVVRDAGVEALLLDQTFYAGVTVAEALKLPSVTVCNALPLNPDPAIPPVVAPLFYSPGLLGRTRNKMANAFLDRLIAPVRTMIDGYRAEWNLPLMTDPNSSLAQIAQLPAAFDLPRDALPAHFHHTGPFHDPASGDAVDFPYERLNGKPLIYASMGTLQNRLQHVFRAIAAACAGLDAQLVISLGNRDQTIPADFPGDPIVVAFAPQLELLKRAALVITHAGLNTALESLAQGVPMVAIPITNDQPGVAARIAYCGVGEVVTLARLNEKRLRAAIQKVLTQESYRVKVVAIQREIALTSGVQRAADIAEQALTTNTPVLRAQ